jgi:hypothetical protein
MSNKKPVRIRVDFPAWSESDKSWFFLTIPNKSFTAWSSGEWFPKKVCTLIEPAEGVKFAVLILPIWLYDVKFGGKVEKPLTLKSPYK